MGKIVVKVALTVGIAGVVGVAGYYGYKIYKKYQEEKNIKSEEQPVTEGAKPETTEETKQEESAA